VVVAVWFAVQRARTPELPIVAPATGVHSLQPDPPAKPPPAAASGNAQVPPTATVAPPLPLGASTPLPDTEPFVAKEKSSAPADARTKPGRWHKGKQEAELPVEMPAVERSERPDRPQPQITRRARSGPLSVDEF
jgi:hypothetical protein